MGSDRRWMYARLKDGLLTTEFVEGIEQFITFAKQHLEWMDGDKLKCPCNHRKFQNRYYVDENTIRLYLMKHGFVPYYYKWILHGEPRTSNVNSQNINVIIEELIQEVDSSTSNTYEQMVMDAAGFGFFQDVIEEPSNPSDQKLYDMLQAANQEVWPGCATHSQLLVVARMLNVKAEHHLSKRCFDDICQLKKEVLLDDNLMTENFYSTKKLVQALGLPVEKIHYSKEMRWHAEHDYEHGVMHHCLDAAMWKHFNKTHPLFAAEVRNTLITELKQLWEVGVETYDASKKNNFNMRVALLWTISDFPVYSMLSDWSIASKTTYPYCREDSDAFTLTKGGKQSWFENHHKFLPADHPFRRNKTAYRKNKTITKSAPPILFGEEILEQIEHLGLMCVTDMGADENNSRKRKNRGKTKDNAKSREDLKVICHRPELERNMVIGKYPKACYTLDKQLKAMLCEWLKNLRFPNGHVSNMGSCIDMRKLKLFGMKSHDCHVFMQRLLPIAFRELLLQNVW
ncbi:uncharacterized protein LOC110654254 [Hevea brasiliensis]|uniref:uncharacterized protein LOC110654254 n=1 Tax=Hevea brasiliensis TaxID=3981 RepID=UPI0025CE61F1|nr:uncharacterized protein LOC110654254 [Hevea brasiliensis]